jgi:phage-related protein
MFNEVNFSYDGISTTAFGLMVVRVGETGMKERPFGVSRNIVEEKIRGKNSPYFYGIEEDPLQFDITLGKEGVWTDDFKKSVVKWLFKNDYKPLISDDNTGIIYYCMAVGTPKFYDNSKGEGYITLTMRCDSPYAWSLPTTEDYDLSTNTGGQIILLNNTSNIVEYYYPEVEITLMEGTDFSLDNLNDTSNAFAFTDLVAGEVIYVNNQRKQIITNQPGLFRYDNFNKNWLKLVQGVNQIQVNGKVKLHFEMQFPVSV